MCSHMIEERLKCNAVPIQLPIGTEDTFKGIIDLVEMDADVYYDDLGKDMRVEAIPADMVDLANEYREKLMDAVSDVRRVYHGDVSGRRGGRPQDQDPRGHPQGHHRQRDGARHLRHLLPATRACRSCWTPSWTICPLPLDIPAIKGVNPKTDEEEDRHCRRQRPLLRPGVQDHDRPLCGPPELLPRLFRHI